MGKDLDILQAVKDNDQANLQKLLQKASKQAKSKIIGNNKRLNINYQDGDGMSALHQAALMSSAPMLRTLLDSGATPGLRDNKGMIALHYATWQGVSQPVQILLQKGSPVNEQALNGETPLHLACQHGHFDVTTLLLNQHADPTICNKGLKTPLDLACEFGRTRVVELLLRSNLCQKLLEDSPTDTLDNNRTTCLHLAARNGHVDIIQILLQAGMNINRSTLKGTSLHEASLSGKIDVVKLLLDCGIDVNKPNSYDQTALDIVNKFTGSHAGKELKKILKEASCALYARAIRDYSNAYDPESLSFKEGDIITVLEQRTDGIWRGYVVHEGRMAKTGMFPANNVVLVDSKVVARQQQQQQQHHNKSGQMYGQVPDLLNRGPSSANSTNNNNNNHYSGSDRGSMGSSGTDDSQPSTPHSFPTTPSTNYPPPPSLMASYPPRSPLTRDPSGADSGFSSSQSLPQYTPSSPATPQQFGKSPFAFGPTVNTTANGNSSHSHISHVNGSVHQDYQHQHLHHHHQQQHGEWHPAPASLPAMGGVGADMRGASPARDSPGHSNRNSAASSDSGRGFSTGHTDPKPVHSYVNVHVHNQQHRLSGQSYESGVSSRQSYHSTSSSSVGSLDRLEEPGFTSTINVAQLFQAGVPDNEVLHAWLHDLHFEEYYPLFLQAGYDMPTISRMTPEDLTAVGITKPAHRKRLKAEIARLNIHDGIPDYKPNDLMEWLHLLGLGAYLDTLCGQGYDNIDYVTDITWEDLEEIGIQKLGHQKKIMLAIDRLKRITSGVKRLSSVDGRTASLELLEPPPPAPPMTGRWSGGEITAIPPHVYDGALGGARPKKSPSGDSISTTSSGNSGSSVGSGAHSSGGGSGGGAGGEMRVIPLPREDAGLAGAMPYRHNSTGSASASLTPDVVAIQVKRNMRSSTSDDSRDSNGQQLMYHSFQGPSGRRASENDVFADTVTAKAYESDSNQSYNIAPVLSTSVVDKRKPIAKVLAKSEAEKHESEINTDGNKSGSNAYSGPNAPKHGVNNNNNNNNVALRIETGEHIYDMPQISPSQKSPKPAVMPKPGVTFVTNTGTTGPLQVNTAGEPVMSAQPKLSPPGNKGSKKVPPPPPKRTHSIRGESSLSDSAPNSPSKVPIAPSTITVSASVHPQPATSMAAKQAPPPVMQKPQKPQSPAVANKLQAHPQHHSQPQIKHQPFSPPVAQKPQSPRPVQSQKMVMATGSPQPHVMVSAPAQGPGHQPQVFVKPKVAAPPQSHTQHQLPKSPLPGKSPLASTVISVPKQQQPNQQPQPPSQTQLTSASHGQTRVGHPPHPAGLQQQAKIQPNSLPSQHVSPTSSGQQAQAQPQQPQVQAFASCVKSLSEKFGKKSDEEDQFPDNVSTDSDDFPPPPPPIAMDIITPKIHNYGIPSRDRGKPEYGLQHQREYTHNKVRPNVTGTRNFVTPASTMGHHPEVMQKGLQKPQSHLMQGVITPANSKPDHHVGGNDLQASKLAQVPQANNSPVCSDHERTPESDVKMISTDKRSESTTSFESNSSSSSVDSNTLPFANENVGTIKQRAANVKPSIVQSIDMEDGQRNVDLNPEMFDRESQRTLSGYSNSSSYLLSSSSSPSYPHNPSTISAQSSTSPQSQRTHKEMLDPASSSSSGAIRPPVPNKKPTLSPKPTRPKVEPKPVQQQKPQPEQPAPSGPEAPQEKPVVETGNVLCDIDNMLQGLTDELDAMLEEEMGS